MAKATAFERQDAAVAALTLKRSLDDPAAAGDKFVAHILMGNPRRSVWLASWAGLPGLFLDVKRKVYTHTLLPGWEYTVAEMKTELIADLERIASHGERPKTASR
jgi:hypothetical protein